MFLSRLSRHRFGYVVIDRLVSDHLIASYLIKDSDICFVNLSVHWFCFSLLLIPYPFNYWSQIDYFRVILFWLRMIDLFLASFLFTFLKFRCYFEVYWQFVNFNLFLFNNFCNDSSFDVIQVFHVIIDLYLNFCFLSIDSIFRFIVLKELFYFHNLFVEFILFCIGQSFAKLV